MSVEDDRLMEALRLRVEASRSPATAEDITRAESTLGFRLPPLLRRLYTEIADGGFGPGYGLFPVRGGRSEPGQEESLVEVRTTFADEVPATLLPLCDWGCATWTCLACSTSDGAIVTLAGEEPLTNTGHDLRSWLSAWLSGTDLSKEMFEPGPIRMGTNPFTKQPIRLEGQGKPRGRPWPSVP